VSTTSTEALDHGFRTGLYVLVGLLVVGAAIAGSLVRPQPVAVDALPEHELEPLREAA
jgi:hypothetical protein